MLEALRNILKRPEDAAGPEPAEVRISLGEEDNAFEPPVRSGPGRPAAAAPSASRRLDLRLLGRLAVQAVTEQHRRGRTLDGDLKLYLDAPPTLSNEQLKLAAQDVEGELARWGAAEGLDLRQVRLSLVRDAALARQELDPAGWEAFQQGGTVRYFSGEIQVQAVAPLASAASFMGTGLLQWSHGDGATLTFGLDRDRWIIGRQADADLRLASPASHRVLAELRRTAGVLWLTGRDGGEPDWQLVPDPRDKARKLPSLTLQRQDGTPIPLGPLPIPLESGDRLGLIDGLAIGTLTLDLAGFPSEWPVGQPFVAPNLANIRAAREAPRLVETATGVEVRPGPGGSYLLERPGAYAWLFRVRASREPLALGFTALG
jgi:hypothetical protein